MKRDLTMNKPNDAANLFGQGISAGFLTSTYSLSSSEEKRKYGKKNGKICRKWVKKGQKIGRQYGGVSYSSKVGE